MIGDSIPTTFWLIATNIVLALAVILCLGTIGWCLMNDIRRLKKQRRDESRVPFDFLYGLESMGVLAGDGQEKIDEMVEE